MPETEAERMRERLLDVQRNVRVVAPDSKVELLEAVGVENLPWSCNIESQE
ncbi:MAG: hypothetical protein IH861_10605 [Chloroflexi bacterium]|nr:hypothetical protein [Chloroflexota bacterium]